MGYSLSWIAVNGRSPEDVHHLLGIKSTGRTGMYGEHPLVGRRLPNGWYLLIANSCDDRIVQKKTLARISRGCRTIACSVEEHVMFSSSALWNDGRKTWSVEHQSERGIFDIKTSGRLPENFPALKARLVAEQKAEGGDEAGADHLFDLPLELAKGYTSFKHDEGTDGVNDGTYEVFEAGTMDKISRTLSAVKPWLVFIIGMLVFGLILAAAGDLVRRAISSLKGALP